MKGSKIILLFVIIILLPIKNFSKTIYIPKEGDIKKYSILTTNINANGMSENDSNEYNILNDLEKLDCSNDTSQHTFIFVISLNTCTDCCSSAINFLIKKINSYNWQLNIGIIVKSNNPKDGFVLKNKFNDNTFFIEDCQNIFDKYFNHDISSELLIVHKNGMIKYKYHDIQHNFPFINITEIYHELENNKVNVKIVKDSLDIEKSVNLIEDENSIISDVSSFALDSSNHLLYLLDNKSGIIQKYNFISGRQISKFRIPDSIRFFCKKESDKEDLWLQLDSIYSPFIRPMSILSIDENFINILVKIIKGYFTKEDDPIKPTIWYDGYAIVKYSEDSVILDTIKESNYIIQLPVLNFSKDSYLATTKWNRLLNHTQLTSSDSLSVLCKIDKQSMLMTPLLHLSDLANDITQTTFNENHFDAITTNNNGTYYLLSENHNKFIIVDNFMIKYISPFGKLSEIFEKSNTQWLVWDIFYSNKILYVLLKRKFQIECNQLIIQKYDLYGQFINEWEIISQSDQLLNSTIIGTYNRNLIILNKWKNKRWTFDYFLL